MGIGINKDRIDELAKLEHGWDSYSGKPPTHKALNVAVNLNVVPTSHGGLEFVWHVNGWDIELSFNEDGEPIGYFQEKRHVD